MLPVLNILRNKFLDPSKEEIDTILVGQTQLKDGFSAEDYAPLAKVLLHFCEVFSSIFFLESTLSYCGRKSTACVTFKVHLLCLEL